MRVWVDMDSGTFGQGEIVYIDLDEKEIEEFSDMADSERIALAEEIRSDQ